MHLSICTPTPPPSRDYVGQWWGFELFNCQLPHPQGMSRCQIPIIYPGCHLGIWSYQAHRTRLATHELLLMTIWSVHFKDMYIKKYVEESSKQLQFYRHAPPCPVASTLRYTTRDTRAFLFSGAWRRTLAIGRWPGVWNTAQRRSGDT